MSVNAYDFVKSCVNLVGDSLRHSIKRLWRDFHRVVNSSSLYWAEIYDISRFRRYQGEAYRGKIASKRRHFYGLKVHLMVSESGAIVEAFFTPGSSNDVLGMRCYRFYLPAGSVMDTDKAYCNYAIEDALGDIEIMFKPLRKKNAKRQYPPPEVYLHQSYRKRVEVTKSLVEKLLPKSIHAVAAHGFELKLLLFLIAINIKMRFKDSWQSRLI